MSAMRTAVARNAPAVQTAFSKKHMPLRVIQFLVSNFVLASVILFLVKMNDSSSCEDVGYFSVCVQLTENGWFQMICAAIGALCGVICTFHYKVAGLAMFPAIYNLINFFMFTFSFSFVDTTSVKMVRYGNVVLVISSLTYFFVWRRTLLNLVRATAAAAVTTTTTTFMNNQGGQQQGGYQAAQGQPVQQQQYQQPQYQQQGNAYYQQQEGQVQQQPQNGTAIV
jgi:hypothetical protein